MNERDHALIVDLIGGLLSPEEERSALARLSTDPEFRAEYESQRAVASLLEAAPPPSMTTDERTRLHAALKAELRLEEVVAPAAARPSRWQRWLAPLGGLAAAAAVLVGVIVVLPQGGDDSSTNVAFEATTVPASSETMSAPETESDGATEAGGAATTTVASAEAQDAAGADEMSESAPAAEAPEESAVGVAPLSVPHLPEIDLELLATQRAAVMDSAKTTADGVGTDARLADCITVLRGNASFASVEPLLTTDYEGTEAFAVEITPLEGDGYLAVYALDTCRELANTQR